MAENTSKYTYIIIIYITKVDIIGKASSLKTASTHNTGKKPPKWHISDKVQQCWRRQRPPTTLLNINITPIIVTNTANHTDLRKTFAKLIYKIHGSMPCYRIFKYTGWRKKNVLNISTPCTAG